MQHTKALEGWYKTLQGEAVAALLRARLAQLWPLAQVDEQMTMLQVGGAPALAKGLWPKVKVTQMTAARAGENIPFESKRFDYILVAHTLEFMADVPAFLAECQRCLVPSGKLLVLAANRRGAWARAEKTPLGVGQPFTAGQLQNLLVEAKLSRTRTDMAVFMPPLDWACVRNAADTFEALGRVLKPWCAVGGGVLLVEARKQVVGGTPIRQRQRRKAPKLRPALGHLKAR